VLCVIAGSDDAVHAVEDEVRVAVGCVGGRALKLVLARLVVRAAFRYVLPLRENQTQKFGRAVFFSVEE
jgi:hypothetical protein